ncbi:hypothetical protein GN956_G14892 [Arapaima gigas]
MCPLGSKRQHIQGIGSKAQVCSHRFLTLLTLSNTYMDPPVVNNNDDITTTGTMLATVLCIVVVTLWVFCWRRKGTPGAVEVKASPGPKDSRTSPKASSKSPPQTLLKDTETKEEEDEEDEEDVSQ